MTDSKRPFNMWIPHYGDVVAVMICVSSILLGWQYHQQVQQDATLRAQLLSQSEAQERHGYVLRQVSRQQGHLTTLQAYFQASEAVSESEFETFILSFLGSSHDQSLCWHDQNGDVFVHGDPEHCRPASDANVADLRFGPPPQIALSASVANTTQAGVVTLVFPVTMLFNPDQTENLDEYFEFRDSSSGGRRVYPRDDMNTAASTSRRPPFGSASFETMRLSVGQLFYGVTPRQRPSLPSNALPVTLAFVGLGVLSALYVRNLIRTQETVQQEVNRRTADLSQFAYRTSHDIRGPLVTIAGLCQAMEEDLHDGVLDEVHTNIRRVRRHVTRLDRLSKNILELTRADLQDTNHEWVNVAALLEDIHQHLRETFSAQHVHLEATVQCEQMLWLPKTRLEQILQNLISNGIKYLDPDKPSPLVHTKISRKNSDLVIDVHDNGLGIPAPFQDRIFEMFERFHIDDDRPGSGLGLSIVKQHVDRLNGQISVESTPAGSTFHITIPVAVVQP